MSEVGKDVASGEVKRRYVFHYRDNSMVRLGFDFNTLFYYCGTWKLLLVGITVNYGALFK